jgi:hypothetical protein
LFVITGSTGYLEISVNQGSAAELVGCQPGSSGNYLEVERAGQEADVAVQGLGVPRALRRRATAAAGTAGMLRHHRQQVPVSPPPFRARPQNAPKSGFGEIVSSPQKVRKSLLVAVRRNVPFPARLIMASRCYIPDIRGSPGPCLLPRLPYSYRSDTRKGTSGVLYLN